MLYGERFERALVYATRLRGDQKRKGTSIPYVTYLLAVAAIVGENSGTENEVVAALPHDTPEDKGAKKRSEDVRERFGDEVAGIVAACTDTCEEPKPAWRPRKEAYVAHAGPLHPREPGGSSATGSGAGAPAARRGRRGTTAPSSTPTP